MPYVVGNIVRPKRTRRSTVLNGDFQDWAGNHPAQGWVEAVHGPADFQTSAPFWDPQTSATDTDDVTEQRYTVKVWDELTASFVSADYPESELDPGSIGGSAITELFPDPAAAVGAKAANLCGMRQ